MSSGRWQIHVKQCMRALASALRHALPRAIQRAAQQHLHRLLVDHALVRLVHHRRLPAQQRRACLPGHTRSRQPRGSRRTALQSLRMTSASLDFGAQPGEGLPCFQQAGELSLQQVTPSPGRAQVFPDACHPRLEHLQDGSCASQQQASRHLPHRRRRSMRSVLRACISRVTLRRRAWRSMRRNVRNNG